MCGEQHWISFDKDERKAILDMAPGRQEIAIEILTGWYPLQKDSIEANNSVGNHIRGEIAERAVQRWLDQHQIRPVTRPDDLRQEFNQKLPDITTPRGTRLDVKTTWGKMRHDQVAEANSEAVVWCYCEMPMGNNDYDTIVPLRIQIVGWNAIDEVNKSPRYPERGVDLHHVHNPNVRCPDSLLAWLGTGNLAEHPKWV